MGNENIQIYKQWYYKPDVKFEIIKFLFNREFAVITPKYQTEQQYTVTRSMTAHNVKQLEYCLWNMLGGKNHDNIFCLYYTMAKYRNGLPRQTYKIRDRDKDLNEDWKNNCWKEIETYDLIIDIDCDTSEEVELYAYPSAKAIKKFLDSVPVPYEARFSGRGFHFIVSGDYFKELNLSYEPYQRVEPSYYTLYGNIQKALSDRFSELVDCKVHDSRQLCKIPYTISFYKDNNYVCLPFMNHNEFERFKLIDYLVENNIKQTFRGRGTAVFNAGTSVSCTILLKKLGVDKDGRHTTSRI